MSATSDTLWVVVSSPSAYTLGEETTRLMRTQPAAMSWPWRRCRTALASSGLVPGAWCLAADTPLAFALGDYSDDALDVTCFIVPHPPYCYNRATINSHLAS